MTNRDKEFQIAFGKHIKKIREQRNWSQEQLSAVSNMEVNQISRIENGRHGANLNTIKALATALGKYPYELFKFDFDFELNSDFNPQNAKTQGPGTTNVINALSESDFFNTPRSVKEVMIQCRRTHQVDLKSSATSGALKKLVNQRILKRVRLTGSQRYLYQKRKS
ncbi:MAG: helix-turn-helix transcriptional regulator [Chryseosolibacter sp.]